MVTHGAQRGAGIGFPTANLEAIDTLIPGDGVYAGRAHVRGQSYPAAINVGHNPTFAEAVHKVEVHLIGLDASIYAEPLEVDFLARLRDIQQFAGVDELKTQLAQDVSRAAQIAMQSDNRLSHSMKCGDSSPP
jgi:riboflavin kinase/FMN adenylyltransferase